MSLAVDAFEVHAFGGRREDADGSDAVSSRRRRNFVGNRDSKTIIFRDRDGWLGCL